MVTAPSSVAVDVIYNTIKPQGLEPFNFQLSLAHSPDEFEPEFDELPEAVQDELLAQAKLIEQFGPTAGRPRVDTLKGSSHANLKELRFGAGGGVWRVAFAFDPRRRAVLLVAGDKSGGSRDDFIGD